MRKYLKFECATFFLKDLSAINENMNEGFFNYTGDKLSNDKSPIR